MTELRWLSLLLGIVVLSANLIIIFQQPRRISNGGKLLSTLIAIVLIFIGFDPNILNGIFSFFNFQAGNGGRIIGLIIFATFFMYLMLFNLQLRTYQLEETIDRLINEMAKDRYRQEHGHLPTSSPIHVIIPAYNEADNIADIISRIPSEINGLSLETTVVVDGGNDGTEHVIRKISEGVGIAIHIINRGGGAAIQAGFDLALEKGAQVIVTLDADGQHLPEEIETVVMPILNGEADMVNGSRVLGTYEKDQFIRATGVVMFNWLVSFLTLQHITDCSNAFRAFSAPKLTEVRPYLKQRQFHSTETLIEFIKRGYRVVEVPITIKRRASGESKKGTTLRYAIGFTRAIFTTWLR